MNCPSCSRTDAVCVLGNFWQCKSSSCKNGPQQEIRAKEEIGTSKVFLWMGSGYLMRYSRKQVCMSAYVYHLDELHRELGSSSPYTTDIGYVELDSDGKVIKIIDSYESRSRKVHLENWAEIVGLLNKEYHFWHRDEQ